MDMQFRRVYVFGIDPRPLFPVTRPADVLIDYRGDELVDDASK